MQRVWKKIFRSSDHSHLNRDKWLQESRFSKTNPKRDWYFWHPPSSWKDGALFAPNIWGSILEVPHGNSTKSHRSFTFIFLPLNARSELGKPGNQESHLQFEHAFLAEKQP